MIKKTDNQCYYHLNFFSFISFYLAVLGFKLRTLCLLSRYLWAITPAFFALAVFANRISCFCSGQPGLQSLHLSLPSHWDGRNVLTTLTSLTYCFGWPWTMILLNSISWVTVFVNMNHSTRLHFYEYYIVFVMPWEFNVIL
jgi:hypothetical protein